ncbi:unnamed protein product [Acanthoscelides obtectus]|uniref:Uncharacterized protein n=1 Tax=Acanthoscelides obtectus TaxID=200917 RepID=A0A9P0Q9A3_ACAOB|nr:unnamed protein product [Acanthoscelides obtectus]CAK1640425.1 hypothetical protein AOBTE_LOCUS11716 [Acanthoscelides obtectus]
MKTFLLQLIDAYNYGFHLKRIKTWLRSTMLQERLVGLALLYMHSDIKIDVNTILDRFASKNNRRLDLLI